MIAFLRKYWIRLTIGAVVIVLAALGVLMWFVQSGRVEQYVVERAKLEAERAIGAKLTIGGLKIDLLRRTATLTGVEMRGKEAATEKALVAADEVRIGVGFFSFSKSRVDLRSLLVKGLKLNIITYPDGSTNFPGPQTKGTGRVLETIVNWRLGHVEVEHGDVTWNFRRTPFELHADDIVAKVDYLSPSRIYKGLLDSANLSYKHMDLPAVTGATTVEFAITQDRIRLERVHFRSGPTTVIQARGELTNLDTPETPFRASFEVDSTVAVSQALPFLPLPVEPQGVVNYTGKLLFDAGRGFELHGDARGRDIYYRDASTRLGPLRATSKLDFLPARLTLSKLRAEGFGGTLLGDFQWDQQEGWKYDGELSGLPMATALKELNVKATPWSGTIHGPVAAQGGKRPLVFTADLDIDAAEGPSPLHGLLAITYDESANRLVARNSFLALPNTRLNFAGDLGKGIALELQSSALRELQPLLELASIEESSLPVSLRKGTMNLNGQFTGSVSSPRFRGNLQAANLIVQGHDVDSVQGSIDYSDQLLNLEGVSIAALGSTAKGNLRAVLDEGKLRGTSIISGKWEAKISNLANLPIPEPVQGAIDLTFAVRGSLQDPIVDGNLKSASLEAREFRFQQIAAAYTASLKEVKVGEWEARIGRQPLRGALNLKAWTEDWKAGSGSATLKAEAMPLNTIPQYSQQDLAVNALLTTDSQFEFNWANGNFNPTKIDGKLSLGNITRYGRPVGQLEFTSRTTGQRAAVTATGSIRQLPVKGDATIQLGSKLDSELRLQLPRLDFPTIAQLFSEEVLPTPLPYEGGAEASFYFKGPLLDPQGWDGRLTIPQMQLAPNKDYVRESMPTVADVVLRNEGPIVVEIRRGQVSMRDVKLVAKDTNLTGSLLYRTTSKSLTGSAKGTVNLAVLSTLKPDLLASGVATVDASIQGNTSDPQVNGRLSFQNASFYLRDVITGLDKVNGTLLFDRSRATIESLTAQTGGGQIQLAGFVGFGRILSYRLQAQATQVRLRYPEGVSTSANATLALTGTTAQSILTGNVTILRSSIGQVDTGQLLVSQTGITDTSTPISNEFLRNLQFDVRVEAAQNVEFATAFTRDVKGEIALRLRGTPQRPTLLGRIAVTQGEVDFFGSRYTISRGEVNFNNPLRIEPVIALDLETRVRGVVIAINLTGPANKLNMSYRSDPPLQSSDILALLTVGRNPGSVNSVAQSGPVGQTQGMFGNDSSVILGAAVTAGINGRLQRFFGISRVRLDPQLTGIDNVPQARLTLEQQVSRDVTLTYITNLNRTQQQIVRIDWDISRTWSVVAVRDENGIFGLDLNFRRRLK